MREKYFKHGDLLNSWMGCGPSQIWKSIWGAGYLVKAGMRLRVGNGEQVRIWGDRWLPIPSTSMIKSPVRILQREAYVKELIDERGYWNESLVNAVLSEEEADRVKSLPLSKRGSEDKLIWGPSKSG